ncbi:MAG: hypothetical protein WCG44_00080 [bacterium]
MESETIYQPTVPVVPPEPVAPTSPSSPLDQLAHFKPKAPIKLVYLVGGVAIILLTLALAVTFFGGSKKSTTGSSTSSTSGADSTVGFITYTNIPHFYTLAIPPKWKILETSPSQEGSLLIETDNQAIMEVSSFKAPDGSLDDYLSSLQDGRSAIKSSAIKAGSYDGVERSESWAKTGLQPIVTYVQIQDKMYIFTLLPSAGKNAISSESLLRDYHSVLSTFALTSTTGLGKDWKEYLTSKVDGLTFPGFTFTHPQSWAVTEESKDKNLIISVYRNNYEIRITQAEVGKAVCLFKDSPDFQGSSGDLRSKEYTEFTTGISSILRRYFNQNEGDKSTIFFCQKETDTPYFSTPTQLGGVAYYVPAKYDQNIVKEMDEIVKTFAPVIASPSATPQ